MGECEFGKCEICGKEAILDRTYFYYPIHCECCGSKDERGQDQHFEMIAHCKNCIPEIPKEIHPLLKDAFGREYRADIKNMMPSNIRGNYNKPKKDEMKKYIGARELWAQPMTADEAVTKGYEVGNHEHEEGYEVEYEDGYKSWSPGNVFTNSYVLYESQIDRMYVELSELELKAEKLNEFFTTDEFKTLSVAKQNLIRTQYDAMIAYKEILAERIRVEEEEDCDEDSEEDDDSEYKEFDEDEFEKDPDNYKLVFVKDGEKYPARIVGHDVIKNMECYDIIVAYSNNGPEDGTNELISVVDYEGQVNIDNNCDNGDCLMMAKKE